MTVDTEVTDDLPRGIVHITLMDERDAYALWERGDSHDTAEGDYGAVLRWALSRNAERVLLADRTTPDPEDLYPRSALRVVENRVGPWAEGGTRPDPTAWQAPWMPERSSDDRR